MPLSPDMHFSAGEKDDDDDDDNDNDDDNDRTCALDMWPWLLPGRGQRQSVPGARVISPGSAEELARQCYLG